MLINLCLIVVIIITGLMIATYNKFIKLDNKVKETESKIDILLNKRFDLIPNLVSCVKQYSKHESDTLEDVTALRSSYKTNGELNIQETQNIDKKVNMLMAVAENYPDLKADTQFIDLQSSLSKIENELSYARENYNYIVTKYNIKVETIPSNLIAKIFFFEKKELFKLEEYKKENIKLDF